MSTPYDHASFETRRKILRWMIHNVGFRFLAKVDRVEGLEHLPAEGPALLMYNHIAFSDPVVILGKMPRNVVPIAKVEAYRIPLWGIFPKLWGVIPVRREEVDRKAIKDSLDVLNAGEVILIAPEGTRNETLQEGKEGIAYLALKANAPIVPVAVSGTKGFPTWHLSRWKGPGAVVKLGRAFRYRQIDRRQQRANLRKMTDEAMYALAALLPEDLRGVYADLEKATTDTIEYI